MSFEREKQRLLARWEAQGIGKRVLDAFKKVPREKFVLEKYKEDAYADVPLPILAGQTISQPTTVVMMLDALEVRQGMKVLEVGAGSGYNAALLSVLVGSKGKIITTEIIPELAEFARKNLKNAGIKNVVVVRHDGSQGFEKEAPYDRIICTAAAPKIPKPLTDQLKEGGVLLVPVGPACGQEMIRARKQKGKIITEKLGGFIFVPLTGKFGE